MDPFETMASPNACSHSNLIDPLQKTVECIRNEFTEMVVVPFVLVGIRGC